MTSYSKIRHGSVDISAEPNPSFSPIRPIPQNLNLFPSKSNNLSDHGAEILRRSRSSASKRFIQEEQSQLSGIQAAVRRAFSMRRSSTIDNGYRRIHDGGDRAFAEEEEDGERGRQGRRKGSSRKGLIGICKKFVGF